MDIATVGGLIIGISAVVMAFLMEGGHLGMVVQAPAMIIVVFGTLGAATITTSFSTVIRIPTYLRIAMSRSGYRPLGTIEEIVRMAERARREGILGLEEYVKSIEDSFFRNAIKLVIDGTEVTVLREILENEMTYIAERHKAGISLFRKLGGFSPTLGIIGTVLGLIHTLASTDDASRMASAIAVAFIATLWGVAMANLFYLPVSDKLRHRHEEEMFKLQLITEGVVSIQSGDNPRVIRTKLMSFMNSELRGDF
jgi:chemotaxis protein MotA